MAAPVIINQDTNSGAGSASVTLNVTAGNTLICHFVQLTSATRTYEVTDNQGNVWTIGEIATNGGRYSGVAHVESAAGGNTTITVAATSGTTTVSIYVYEISPSELADSDQNVETTNVTNHICGTINVPADSFVIAGVVFNASGGTVTKNADYTNIETTVTQVSQYRITSSPLTGETAVCTTTTARQHCGVIAAFVLKSDEEPNVVPEDIELTPLVESAAATTAFPSTPGEVAATPQVEAVDVITSFNAVCHDIVLQHEAESLTATTGFSSICYDIAIQAEVSPAEVSTGQQVVTADAVLPIEIESIGATTRFTAVLHDIELPLEVEHAEPSFTEIPQIILSDSTLTVEIEQMTPIVSYTASLYDISLPLEVFSDETTQPVTGNIFGIKTASGYFFLRV